MDSKNIIEFIKKTYPKVIFTPFKFQKTKSIGFIINDNSFVIGYINKDGNMSKLIEPVDLNNYDIDVYSIIANLPIVNGFSNDDKQKLMKLFTKIPNGSKSENTKIVDELNKRILDLESDKSKLNSDYKILYDGKSNDIILVKQEYDEKIKSITAQYNQLQNQLEECKKTVVDQKEAILKGINQYKDEMKKYIESKDLKINDLEKIHEQWLLEKEKLEKQLNLLLESEKEKVTKLNEKQSTVTDSLTTIDEKTQMVSKLEESIKDIKAELSNIKGELTKSNMQVDLLNGYKSRCKDKILNEKDQIIQAIKDYNSKWVSWSENIKTDAIDFKRKLLKELELAKSNLKGVLNHQVEKGDMSSVEVKRLKQNITDIETELNKTINEQLIQLSAKDEEIKILKLAKEKQDEKINSLINQIEILSKEKDAQEIKLNKEMELLNQKQIELEKLGRESGSGYEDEKKKWQEERSQIQEELKKTKEELNDIKGKLDGLRSEHEKLIKQYEEQSGSSKKETGDKLDVLEKELLDNKAQFEKTKVEYEKLKEELNNSKAEWEKKKSELEKSNQDLQSAKTDFEKSQKSFVDEKKILEEELKKTKEELNDIKGKLDGLRTEHEKLTKQYEEQSGSSKKETGDKLDVLEKELLDNKAQFEKTKVEYEKLKEELNNSKAEWEKKKSELEKSNQDLQSAKTDFEKSQKSFVDEKKILEDELTNIKKELNDTKEEWNKGKEEWKVLYEKYNKESGESKKQLEDQLQSLQKELEETKTKIKSSKDEYEKTKSELESLYEKTKGELGVEKERVKELENSLKEKSGVGKTNLEKEILELKSTIKERDDLIAKLNENIKTLNSKMDVLIKEKDDEIKLLTKQRDDLSSENSNKSLEINNLASNLKTSNDKLIDLQKQLDQVNLLLKKNNNTKIETRIDYDNCYSVITNFVALNNIFFRKQEIIKKLDAILSSNKGMENLSEELKKSIKQNFEKVKSEITKHIKFLNLSEYIKSSNFELLKNKATRSKVPESFCSDISNLLQYWEANKKVYREQDFKLMNIYEDLSGAVRIYIRIKPLIGSEIKKQVVSLKTVENKKIKYLNVNCSGNSNTKYKDPKTFGEFFGIFEKDYSNLDIFTGIKGSVPIEKTLKVNFDNLIESTESISPGLYHSFKQIEDGYSIVLFGYGASGSGKTHSLLGDKTTPGVLHYGLANLENVSNIKVKNMFELYCNVSKINYNNRQVSGSIYNLVNSISELKEFQKDESSDFKSKIPNYINLTNLKVENLTELTSVINNYRVSKNRIRKTPNNPESSRSHLYCVFEIKFTNNKIGYVTIVDTAGRESPMDIFNMFIDTSKTKLQSVMAPAPVGGVGNIEKNMVALYKKEYKPADVFSNLNESFYINETLNHLVYYFNTKMGKQVKVIAQEKDIQENVVYNIKNYFVSPKTEIASINPNNNSLMIPILNFLDNLSKTSSKTDWKPTKFITLCCVRQEESYCDQTMETINFADSIYNITKSTTDNVTKSTTDNVTKSTTNNVTKSTTNNVTKSTTNASEDVKNKPYSRTGFSKLTL